MPTTAAERAQFQTEGYFVRRGFLDAAAIRELGADVDKFAGQEALYDGRNVAGYAKLAALTVHAETLSVVTDLLAPGGILFHHCHVAKHMEGLAGVAWHHDYEQVPQTNRSHKQLHVFHYLNGLNGTVGDLLLLPRSQKRIWRRDAMNFFGEEDLPGMVVLDDLPPGSSVFVNSALTHARRGKPGGGNRPRYFVDICYMQRGILWPSYGQTGWQEMLTRLDALFGALHPGLFDPNAFFDIAEVSARMKDYAGSMALVLPSKSHTEQ
jgi:hypothetical protein